MANDPGSAWIEAARRGRFADAWRISDGIVAARRRHPRWDIPRHLQVVWDGTPIDGRRVLIRCYHGLGDTIQYIRFAPLVQARAREVIVWAQPALLPILASARGIDRLIPLHDGVPDVACDVDVETMELAHVFRTTVETIPAGVPYLHAEAAALPHPHPRVGVVWRAGTWDSDRSVPFHRLARLLDRHPAIAWFSLQQDHLPAERHPGLQRPDVGSIATLASVIRAMDLVVTVDTMTAHLAGALAVPVWTLLRVDADWRWMEGRSDSPWYPSMRLFRQTAAGDWAGVLRRVALAFDGLAVSPSCEAWHREGQTPKGQTPAAGPAANGTAGNGRD